MLKFTNIVLFLTVSLVSLHLSPTQCLTEYNYERDTCNEDPYYQEDKIELAQEIQNVNEYMKIIADQLHNDGVIVVRASRTQFTHPKITGVVDSETKDYSGDELENNPNRKTIIASTEPELTESPCTDVKNSSLLEGKSSEIKQNNFEVDESLSNIENQMSNDVKK